MYNAKTYKQMALKSLRGSWPFAILVGFIAFLLGCVDGGLPTITFHHEHAQLRYGGIPYYQWRIVHNNVFWSFFLSFFKIIVLIALVVAIVYFILGGIISVGYAKFNLDLVEDKGPSLDALFSYFRIWKTITIANVFCTLMILLGSMLFIVPGIIFFLEYAMVDYILALRPDLSAWEAIKLSKSLMQGKRWKLFCLEFSFIGWRLLAAISFGIINLGVRPYYNAAHAHFFVHEIRKSSFDMYNFFKESTNVE